MLLVEMAKIKIEATILLNEKFEIWFPSAGTLEH